MLEDFLNEAKTRNIYVVGIVFPQNPGYRETGAFGRYGPQRSVAMSILDSLDKMQEKFPNFILMDENKMGNHDYTDDEAWNTDHLAFLGAVKISGRLDSLLSTLK